MKKIKKLFVLGMVIVMAASSASVVPAEGKAKVKLNKKRIEIKVGKTYKLKVKGTKKKVKWSSDNKKVATVKKGTVKGVTPGSANITAKVGKKKMSCKVTVRYAVAKYTPAPVVTAAPIVTSAPIVDPQQEIIANNALAANIAARADKLVSGKILFTIINNNTVAVPNVKLSVMFRNSEGVTVDTHTVTVDDILPGETAYGIYVSSNCKDIDTATSVISVAVTQKSSTKKYVTDSVSVTGSKNTDNKYVMTYVNNTLNTAYLRGYIFYKDAAGAIIAVDELIENLSPGETKFDTLSRPYYRYDIIGHEAFEDIEYEKADYVYKAYYY